MRMSALCSIWLRCLLHFISFLVVIVGCYHFQASHCHAVDEKWSTIVSHRQARRNERLTFIQVRHLLFSLSLLSSEILKWFWVQRFVSLSFLLPLPSYFHFRHVAYVYSCGVIVTCSVGDDAFDDDDVVVAMVGFVSFCIPFGRTLMTDTDSLEPQPIIYFYYYACYISFKASRLVFFL